MTQGLDSGARIPAAAAAQRGFTVLFRYLYNVTPNEVADIMRAGRSLSLIAEFDTTTWHPVSQSPTSGEGHGQIAARQAQALGAPAGTIIWATADTWVPQSGYGNVAAYLDGFRRGLGQYRPGLYGGARLVRAMIRDGKADAGWVAGADSWNDGVRPQDAGAVAHQLAGQTVVGGTNCDLNDMYLEPAGFWYPPLGATATAADTAPTPEEDIMATLAELQQVVAAQADRVIAAIPKPAPVDDGRWMATFQAEGKVYVVINGVRYHVPGGATEEDTNHRLELLELQGFDNRGVQDAALSVLPEAPFSIVAS